MGIKEVRKKFPDYKISYIPKKDYLKGITGTRMKKRTQTSYDEVFISRKEDKYYLLYPTRGHFTGSFDSRQKTINWFKNGGR